MLNADGLYENSLEKNDIGLITNVIRLSSAGKNGELSNSMCHKNRNVAALCL